MGTKFIGNGGLPLYIARPVGTIFRFFKQIELSMERKEKTQYTERALNLLIFHLKDETHRLLRKTGQRGKQLILLELMVTRSIGFTYLLHIQ